MNPIDDLKLLKNYTNALNKALLTEFQMIFLKTDQSISRKAVYSTAMLRIKFKGKKL